jgi:hypothetical protein
MLYKILTRKYHSLASGMTPYWPLLTRRQFSNSNYDKPRLPRLKLCLQRSSNANVLQHHQIKSCTLPFPHRDKRDHRQQFTHKTSPMCHYLRWWLHLGHSARHLRGCPLAHRISRPATCLKTNSVEWTQPTWPSPSETTIGLGSTKKMPSSTPSPEKKWNTRHS